MKNKNQTPHINVDYFEDLTGAIQKPEIEISEGIGNRIKRIRKEKGLSIDELSNLTGFNIEILSNIELNKIQPKLGTIIKFSKALDSAFTRVVSGTGDRLYSITRKNEQKTIQRPTSRKGNKLLYSYKSLAPEVKGRHMEALIVHLEENADNEMSTHEGEEFVYILDGVAVMKIGEDTYDLEPGDSIYYLSTIPHQITSKRGVTTLLAIIYEGNWNPDP